MGTAINFWTACRTGFGSAAELPINGPVWMFGAPATEIERHAGRPIKLAGFAVHDGCSVCALAGSSFVRPVEHWRQSSLNCPADYCRRRNRLAARRSGCAENDPMVIVPARQSVQHELSILALLKGKERYLFVYDDESREDVLNAIRDQAARPTLTFSWFDAAILTERARQQMREAEAERQTTRNPR
jgi:hypothetical protein